MGRTDPMYVWCLDDWSELYYFALGLVAERDLSVMEERALCCSGRLVPVEQDTLIGQVDTSDGWMFIGKTEQPFVLRGFCASQGKFRFVRVLRRVQG